MGGLRAFVCVTGYGQAAGSAGYSAGGGYGSAQAGGSYAGMGQAGYADAYTSQGYGPHDYGAALTFTPCVTKASNSALSDCCAYRSLHDLHFAGLAKIACLPL